MRAANAALVQEHESLTKKVQALESSNAELEGRL
jgi:hypothetical protein